MVRGLGTDLVEIERVEAIVTRHGDAFLRKVFTERERLAFGPRDGEMPDDGSTWLQQVAARYAAKEAALKALGTGWGQGLSWHHVEVLGGRGSPPALELSGPARERLAALGADAALVSLTHTENLAGATVLLT